MEKEKQSLIENKYLNSYLENDDEDELDITNVFTQNTFIYSWGKNKYGELGLGHTENALILSPVKSLHNLLISQVASGGKHTAILTKDNKIYVCGTDVLGLLGIENKKWKEQHKFQKMYSLEQEEITQIACAEFHTLSLTKDGSVYAWGGNLHNKLGQSNTVGLPMKITTLLSKKIIQISCGDYHSTALSEAGEVFSWGGGGQYNRGQCGHGDLKEVESPKRIDYFKHKKVIKVVCGGYHTIVLCQDNNLYGFGKSTYGQCGYGISEDATTPKLIKFSRKTVLYEQNVVNKNELSQSVSIINPEESNNTSIYKSPVIIKDIKCGGEHTIVLSSFGRVYTFGHGYTGQLGLGNTKNYDRPMIVKSLIKKTVTQIAAGWSHSMVLTSEGNLYIAGCGKYGELGLNDLENRKGFTLVKPASILNITNIFAGGHHSWLIVDHQNPERSDFEIPSPLGSGNFSPNLQRSSENSPRNNKPNSSHNLVRVNPNQTLLSARNISNIRYNLDQLNEKLNKTENKIFLQVAYTDLKMSHRFVRFSVKKQYVTNDNIFKELNSSVNNYLSENPFISVYRLQDDNEVDFKKMNPSVETFFKEFKSSLKTLDTNNKRSFSLMMVFDVNKNEKMINLKSNIENIKINNEIFKKHSNKTIYDVVNITEEDIRSSHIEEIMSTWILEFMQNFSNYIDTQNELPRFMELRPNHFLI